MRGIANGQGPRPRMDSHPSEDGANPTPSPPSFQTPENRNTPARKCPERRDTKLLVKPQRTRK